MRMDAVDTVQSGFEYDVFIVGLGFVGLTLAAKISSVGQLVHGVERHGDTLEKLKSGKPHFYEHKLDEILQEVVSNKKLLIRREICDFNSEKRRPRLYILTIGTPTTKVDNNSGNIIQQFVLENLNEFENGDILMLRSTVAVGTCDGLLKLFEECKKNIHLSFCPERTVEGQALSELSSLPQIISASHPIALDAVSRIFKCFTTTIPVPSLRDAELAKLVCNVQRDIQFGFANEVLELAQQLDCDFSAVRNACNYKYPRSNLYGYGPVAGPCLEKDAYILAETLDKKKRGNFIFEVARKKNENFLSLILYALDKYHERDIQRVGIMGLAFKGNPETDDLRGSYVFDVIDHFVGLDKNVMLFDRIVNVNSIKEHYDYSDYVTQCFDPQTFILENDLVILQNDSSQIDLPTLERSLELRKRPLLFLSMTPYERLFDSSQIRYLMNMKNLDIIKL